MNACTNKTGVVPHVLIGQAFVGDKHRADESSSASPIHSFVEKPKMHCLAKKKTGFDSI